MTRILIYICLTLLYISCKNETNQTVKQGIDSSLGSEKAQKIYSIASDDSALCDSLHYNKKGRELNSVEVFDPKKTPSSILPKNPVSKEMPLPGGIPSKHYIDSVKNARSKK
ncbi:MAG: hypothetical protein SGJ10_14545 [Bacteroidota bacterium]|nr:hypothetical protein [Bacteroidota bacterium]